jgi:hypothetical protein
MALQCSTQGSALARVSVDEKRSGQGPGAGPFRDAVSRFSARQRQGKLRVILPRMCRLSEPADYCHSNKYPLWVSAIDENARSLRPDFWRVNLGYDCAGSIKQAFRKGSGRCWICVQRNPVGAGLPAKRPPHPTSSVADTELSQASLVPQGLFIAWALFNDLNAHTAR